MCKIFTIQSKKEERILRKKTKDFDFTTKNTTEINQLIQKMRRIMHEASGIGLAANQIGLDMRVFVAEIKDKDNKSKFYALFNPEIEKAFENKTIMEEGCLSVPGKYGFVERHSKIVVKGYDKKGKLIKIKAWGLLARVFQHEIDHLNGILFIDKAKEIYEIKKESEERE